MAVRGSAAVSRRGAALWARTMNYALAFLTQHGREYEAAETLASFERAVTPKPVVAVCHTDGPGVSNPPFLYESMGWISSHATKQEGFCRATATLWNAVAGLDTVVDWVFWLEDDFRFIRAIDLLDIAHVMTEEPALAQMAFMRQPCNTDEVRAGSYIAVNPDAYRKKGSGNVAWFEHSHHWTTNPSLIKREVIAAHAWPENTYCEGYFGSQIQRDRSGTSFGIWGVGDPWIEHFGVRRGSGY